MIDIQQQFSVLEQRIASTWAEILDRSALARAIRDGEFSPELYMIYMLETYHYTAHNARNQALTGVAYPQNPVYMKFCFDHAADEAGHEMMALHDLRSLGPADMELALPAPARVKVVVASVMRPLAEYLCSEALRLRLRLARG